MWRLKTADVCSHSLLEVPGQTQGVGGTTLLLKALGENPSLSFQLRWLFASSMFHGFQMHHPDPRPCLPEPPSGGLCLCLLIS